MDDIRRRLEEIFEDEDREWEGFKTWKEARTLVDVSDEELQGAIQDENVVKVLTLMSAGFREEELEEISEEELEQRSRRVLTLLVLEYMRRRFAFDRAKLKKICNVPIDELDRGMKFRPIEFFRGLARRITEDTGIELNDDAIIELIEEAQDDTEMP